MAEPLSLQSLFSDSLKKTAQIIAPSFPFALLFVCASGGLVWAAGALPQGTAASSLFVGLVFATVFAHSLFSAAMYRSVLPSAGRLLRSAWVLTLAWLLMLVIVAIGATMIVLFFSLIGSSLGVVSGEAGQEITDMTAQMRASGTFWPLFTLFALTLLGVFWFAVRMMLFAGATVTRCQIHVFRTWYWTKGYFRALAPVMLALILLPLVAFSSLASLIVDLVFGAPETPLETGLSTAFVTFILLPSAWLGHGFAASALEQLGDHSGDQTTTPA